jgi:tetratricopeptide (TPR) repeat protein
MRLRICLTLTMTLAIAAAHCLGQAATAPYQQRQTALALEQQGKNSEAEAAWRLYMKAHPSNPEPYAHLGLLEARQEHYEEAVPFYRRALALNSAIPGLRLNLGLALFKGGELKQAIVEFKPLLKSQPPGSPEAQRLTILLGMAHYGLGEYAAAAPYLKQAAAHDPQNRPLRLALAHSCLWSKQYQCVLDTYHEILTLNAESAEADMLAGEAQDELKNTGGAVQEFRDAEKANPREPDVHFGLGYLLWRLMQYEEAAKEFQAELANNPDHGQAMAYLGDTEMKLGQPETALPVLEKAIRIDPRNELAHLDLGTLYGNAGRRDEALRELKIAEELSPNDQNVHWRLGRFYQTMGRKDEAKIEFDKTRSLQKAADETTFKKLHPIGEAPGAPAAK